MYRMTAVLKVMTDIAVRPIRLT